MIHQWRSPGSRSEDWTGLVLAAAVVVLVILTIAKAGWPAVAPFALAGVVVAGVFVYLRWLDRLAR
ncbi:MAG: hypothetical protein HW409_1000 [candidate division NC10 bacterium]|jgi:uncharacterized membrane protein|nr:hypothetical protein [candidate division NC10 bacterium]